MTPSAYTSDIARRRNPAMSVPAAEEHELLYARMVYWSILHTASV